MPEYLGLMSHTLFRPHRALLPIDVLITFNYNSIISFYQCKTMVGGIGCPVFHLRYSKVHGSSLCIVAASHPHLRGCLSQCFVCKIGLSIHLAHCGSMGKLILGLSHLHLLLCLRAAKLCKSYQIVQELPNLPNFTIFYQIFLSVPSTGEEAIKCY